MLNGVYSAIPYTLFGLLALTSGQMADFMRARCRIPTVIVRKVFTSAGGCGLDIRLLLLCGDGQNRVKVPIYQARTGIGSRLYINKNTMVSLTPISVHVQESMGKPCRFVGCCLAAKFLTSITQSGGGNGCGSELLGVTSNN